MRNRLFPPHPLLADLIHCLVVTPLPGGHYMLPAGLQPVLLVILRGGILVDHADGPFPMARLALSGGTSGPRSATAETGTEILTVSIQAGKLRNLLGLPAGAIMEELLPLRDMLPRSAIDELEDRLADSADTVERVAAFQDFLLGLRMGMGSGKTDLLLPLHWTDRPVAELADQFGIGIRQFERRFAASYGQTLRAFRQQLRCSRMITHLVCSNRPNDGWAAIAAEAGYCDQAHLSRDVLRYTGYTPTQLIQGIASGDPAMWPYRFNSTDLTEMFGTSGF